MLVFEQIPPSGKKKKRNPGCLVNEAVTCDTHLSQHSIRKGLLEEAKYANRSRSSVAPRLSEFETNMYFTPSDRSCKYH